MCVCVCVCVWCACERQFEVCWYVCRSRKRHYSIYPSSLYALRLTYNLLGWIELQLHRLPTLPLSQTRCLQQSYAFTHQHNLIQCVASCRFSRCFPVLELADFSRGIRDVYSGYTVDWMTGDSGFDYRQRQISFLFIAPISALHPTQSHIQQLIVAVRPGVK